MTEPLFFKRECSLTLREIIARTGAEWRAGSGGADALDRRVTGVAALDHAGPCDLTFFENPKYVHLLPATQAGACITSTRFKGELPPYTVVLRSARPYRTFVEVARALFPDALRPSSLLEGTGVSANALVDASARLESGVNIDPAAVVGPQAEIGMGTSIGAGAVIGPGVRIGRGCSIGATSTITNAILGDRVIVHPGCHIGQDGFGYVLGPSGHLKVPQIGRVIIQNDVEIGAGSAIDRGAIRDTIVGEGTKIDNLVQVGHNVLIGRHCVVAAGCAISGSSTLEDFVVLGGRVSINNHITVGEGAQVAATAGIIDDVPRGERWAGTPAKRARAFFREMVVLRRLAMRSDAADAAPHEQSEGRKGNGDG